MHKNNKKELTNPLLYLVKEQEEERAMGSWRQPFQRHFNNWELREVDFFFFLISKKQYID